MSQLSRQSTLIGPRSTSPRAGHRRPSREGPRTDAANPNPSRRFLMPRRRLAHVHAELSEGITNIEIARAQLFAIDMDRKKRIDATIDYFGAGRAEVTATPAARAKIQAETPARHTRGGVF